MHPSLTDLSNGDLNHQVDFRSVYYTMIEDWLHGDAKAVLGKKRTKRLNLCKLGPDNSSTSQAGSFFSVETIRI